MSRRYQPTGPRRVDLNDGDSLAAIRLRINEMEGFDSWGDRERLFRGQVVDSHSYNVYLPPRLTPTRPLLWYRHVLSAAHFPVFDRYAAPRMLYHKRPLSHTHKTSLKFKTFIKTRTESSDSKPMNVKNRPIRLPMPHLSTYDFRCTLSRKT